MEEDDDYEEPPWQGPSGPLPTAFPAVNMPLLPVAEESDQLLRHVDALRAMVSTNQFPDELYQLIKGEMVTETVMRAYHNLQMPLSA